MRHKGYEGQDGLQGLTEQGLMGLGKAVAGVGTARYRQKVVRKWEMAGCSSGLGNPHLMLILVPYSNFRGCLCL